MALDPVKNFAISRVATAPSPADSGTTLVVEAGDGVLFPDPSSSGAYNVVVYPNGEQPTSTNAEIVRVTARTSDTMTITREQESTSARTVAEGDIVMLGITAKVVEDLDDIATVAAGIATEFNGGWISAEETWTYAGADDPTFTFTVAADVTTKYSAGMRIKLTQGTVKYFIITAVSTYSGGNTTITIYGGTDYDLASSAISANYYSTQKAPHGFPLSPAKWSQTKTHTTANYSVTSPTSWQHIGLENSLIIPIGVWNVSYWALIYAEQASGNVVAYSTLSTTTSSETNTDFTCSNIGMTSITGGWHTKSAFLSLSSKTTYYLIGKSSGTSIGILGTYGKCVIRATCAYL